jgi:hypothetical protein
MSTAPWHNTLTPRNLTSDQLAAPAACPLLHQGRPLRCTRCAAPLPLSSPCAVWAVPHRPRHRPASSSCTRLLAAGPVPASSPARRRGAGPSAGTTGCGPSRPRARRQSAPCTAALEAAAATPRLSAHRRRRRPRGSRSPHELTRAPPRPIRRAHERAAAQHGVTNRVRVRAARSHARSGLRGRVAGHGGGDLLLEPPVAAAAAEGAVHRLERPERPQRLQRPHRAADQVEDAGQRVLADRLRARARARVSYDVYEVWPCKANDCSVYCSNGARASCWPCAGV